MGLLGLWVYSSMVIYLLWHILWRFWDIKLLWQKLVYLLGGFLFIISIIWLPTILAVDNLEDDNWFPLFRIIMGMILLAAVQYALKAQESIAHLLLEKEQMQTENYKAQLKALRAQIDPHFLFNTLNTLRSMVRQQHPNSERFIISLSDFYRKTLKHNNNASLPLSEELAVLESYLFVMKSRNEEAIDVQLNVDPSVYQRHLPALALQIVVENCFKHNSMTSKMPLKIEVKDTEDAYVQVSNNIQPKLGYNSPSGYGLDLLRKRYELLKIDQGLIIEKTADQYTARLKLI